MLLEKYIRESRINRSFKSHGVDVEYRGPRLIFLCRRSTGDPRDSLNVTDSLTIEKERDDPEYKAHQPRFTEVGEQSSEHVREGFGRLSLDQQRLNPLKRDPQHFAQGGDDVTRKRLNKSRGKKPPDNRDQELDHERPSGPEPSHYAEFESSNPDLNTSGTGIPQSIPAHHQTGNAPARARVDKSSGNLQMVRLDSSYYCYHELI